MSGYSLTISAKAAAAPARKLVDAGLGLAPPAPAAASSAAAVTVVPATRRRYRATVRRSVTEVAIVEFEASETDDRYQLAGAIAKEVPAGAWTRAATGSDYAYLDSVEDLGAASAAAGKSVRVVEAKGDVVQGPWSGSEVDQDDSANIAIADDVAQFVGEFLRQDDGSSITVDNAYERFVAYCAEFGLTAMPQSDFKAAMQNLGFMSQRIAGADRFIGITAD